VLRVVQRETGVAIMLVEHDVPMVESLVDRVYVLDAGQMIAFGSTSTVLASSEVRRAYLGVE
jgi:branched-chain amino acid transport system ATP-binding protein